MPIDIYTKQLIQTATDEHVLPQSLGGKLFRRGLIDKTTNDRFGHGIDARLDEALRVFRVILDARNANGNSPRSLTKIPGADGKHYTVEAGGTVKPRPSFQVTDLPSGEKRVQASVSSEQDLRNLLKPHFRGRAEKLDAAVSKLMTDAVRTKLPIPELTFGPQLWDTDPYRATAKVAFNLLALTHQEAVLANGFDEIRSFILDGTNPSVPPVQACTLPEAVTKLGPVDHIVVVEIKTEEVLASVTYWGHLSFVVRLGIAGDVHPTKVSYRVDQLAGTDRHNHPDDLALPLPSFQEAAERTYEELLRCAITQLEELVPLAESLQRANFIRGVMHRHFEELKDDNHRSWESLEQRQDFLIAKAKEIAAELASALEQGGQSVDAYELVLRDSLLKTLEPQDG